jgi:hypothetical protein
VTRLWYSFRRIVSSIFQDQRLRNKKKPAI